ncbi:endolysin [Arthrobacter phage Colucci]|uniref:Endolysin n=1 Tax=Arthrobacter phage Colucci TaxID=2015834 RepID=A0A286N2Y5_9CAUD|nr:endolysin [Arthrobacter phage Colucci]ASX98742.1 endolysin [Arthrobacter phage Colucci]
MTKRQFLVTVEGDAASDDKIAALIRGVLDGKVSVSLLADKVGGLAAHWDADAPPGSIMVFQADKREPVEYITAPGKDYGPTPEEWDQLRERVKDMVRGNPWGHVEVMQPDGTMAPPPVPGAILGTGGWVVQDPPPSRYTTHPFKVTNGPDSSLGSFRDRATAEQYADQWNKDPMHTGQLRAEVKDTRHD